MAGRIAATTAVVLLLAAAAVFFYVYSSDLYLNYNVINLIEQRQDKPGKFIDMDGQVQVESVDDLGYILKDNKIELHYGVQVIDIPYNSLDNQKWTDALSTIGIKVFRRTDEETGKTEYRLKYWDEVIQEWSRVSS